MGEREAAEFRAAFRHDAHGARELEKPLEVPARVRDPGLEAQAVEPPEALAIFRAGLPIERPDFFRRGWSRHRAT
jgi:hypothetical protein